MNVEFELIAHNFTRSEIAVLLRQVANELEHEDTINYTSTYLNWRVCPLGGIQDRTQRIETIRRTQR